MTGVLCMLAGSGSGLSYNGTVVVGESSISGKGFSVDQWGYGDSTVAVAGSTFGSRNPTTTNGFTILGIFWESSSPSGSQITSLVISGDSSGFAAAMSINGTDQGLGAGTYSAPNTTYTSVSSSLPNPFGGLGTTSTVVIA